MIRLSRLADYGVALMTQIALAGDRVHSAQELAASTGVPLPTVSKLLASLARADLLVASRGARGGYRLARPAQEIPVGAIVSAVDGPIALTQCIERGPACWWLRAARAAATGSPGRRTRSRSAQS